MGRKIDWQGSAGEALGEAQSPAKASYKISADDSPVLIPITVIFQDEDTLACARPICGRLICRFGPDSFRLSLWPLNVLENPMVFADTANADVAILALRGDEPLPAVVKTWIKTWQQGRIPNAGAIVAMFLTQNGNHGGTVAPDQELQALQHFAGLDYFSHVFVQPSVLESGPATPLGKSIIPMTGGSSEFMNPTDLPGPNHWGLNE